MTDLKGETDKSIIVGDFITPLSVIDTASRKRLWKI